MLAQDQSFFVNKSMCYCKSASDTWIRRGEQHCTFLPLIFALTSDANLRSATNVTRHIGPQPNISPAQT